MPGAAKAWVNFNGTGTVAIRAAFNVTSITDNGTGDYTVTFTTALVDANYCLSLSGVNTTATTSNTSVGVGLTGGSNTDNVQLKSTSQVRIFQKTGGGTFVDSQELSVAVFR
jgi:hypothetical protein